MSDPIAITFGDGADVDTFRTVFKPLVGWVVQVTDLDGHSFDLYVEALDDGEYGEAGLAGYHYEAEAAPEQCVTDRWSFTYWGDIAAVHIY